MNTNTQIDKIDKVLSKISGKEMKGFVRQYAATHEDFATALVEKYWKPERGNYKEQVEACFAHAGVLGKRFGQPQLDWRKIEQDLGAMMRKAKSMKKKGNLIDAALIAGYVMTITCREFKHDHLAYTPARYDVWAEENKVLKDIVTQSADMVRELLINSDEIEEDSRLGMLGEIAEQCEEIGDNYFMRFEWFVDEAMPLLCGDDEKAYLAHISKRLKNKKEKYFHYRYYIQKADYWAAHGKRAKAEKLMWEERLDLLKDMFEHKHWNLWELYPEYIKYVPKQDHAFVGEILFKDIKRLALLKEKPKEFNWLLGQIERVMRKSAAVDKMIKNGIRQLIADYPDKYYFKSYLGSIL